MSTKENSITITKVVRSRPTLERRTFKDETFRKNKRESLSPFRRILRIKNQSRKKFPMYGKNYKNRTFRESFLQRYQGDDFVMSINFPFTQRNHYSSKKKSKTFLNDDPNSEQRLTDFDKFDGTSMNE